MARWNKNSFVYQKVYGEKLCSAYTIQKPPDILTLPKLFWRNSQTVFPQASTEILVSTIKGCSECLKVEPSPSQNLKTPLQSVSSLTSFPGETLQIYLVEPLKSQVDRYVLTAIDAFRKYLFAVLWTNVRADTIARKLTSISSRQFFCQKRFLLTKEHLLFGN